MLSCIIGALVVLSNGPFILTALTSHYVQLHDDFTTSYANFLWTQAQMERVYIHLLQAASGPSHCTVCIQAISDGMVFSWNGIDVSITCGSSLFVAMEVW